MSGLGTGKSTGRQYVIEPRHVEKRGILITVSLSPDVPSDQLRRANTANMLVQLGYPRARALQDVGVNDPEMAMSEARFDQYIDHLYSMKMKADNAEMDIQIQAALAQMMGGGQGGAPQGGGGGGGQVPGEEVQPSPEELQMMAEMQQGVGGQGFDPSMGGDSPVSAMAEDEVLREMVQEEDISGAAVMPPELA